jgi:hypothetical protein
MFNNKRIAAIEEILEWQGKLNEATIGRQDALEQKFEEDNGFHLERVGKLAIICSQLERKVAATLPKGPPYQPSTNKPPIPPLPTGGGGNTQ